MLADADNQPSEKAVQASGTVAPEDIAITIVTYMGTKPPSGSLGEVLYEALPAGPRSVQAASSQ